LSKYVLITREREKQHKKPKETKEDKAAVSCNCNQSTSIIVNASIVNTNDKRSFFVFLDKSSRWQASILGGSFEGSGVTSTIDESFETHSQRESKFTFELEIINYLAPAKVHHAGSESS
jgi:hypothetical protein